MINSLIFLCRNLAWLYVLALMSTSAMLVSCTSIDPRVHLTSEVASNLDDIQIIEAQNDSNLKKVTMLFDNIAGHEMYLKYRFTWFNRSGVPIEGIASRPAIKYVAEDENDSFSGIAPNDQAVNWRLNVAVGQ